MGTLQTLSRQLSGLSAFGFQSNLILVNPQDLDEIRASNQYRPYTRATARPEWEGRCVGILAGRQVIETSQVNPGFPDLVLDAGSTSEVLRLLRLSRQALIDTRDSLAGMGIFGDLWSKLRAIWKGSDSWTEKKTEEQPNR